VAEFAGQGLSRARAPVDESDLSSLSRGRPCERVATASLAGLLAGGISNRSIARGPTAVARRTTRWPARFGSANFGVLLLERL